MWIMEEKKESLFTNESLGKLLLPLIVEQFLLVAMGMADTFMVASCGEAAVSGISLVDTLAILLIGLLSAMASGGAVVVAQFTGKQDKEMIGRASNQLFLAVGGVSLFFMVIALVWNQQILQMIYGAVEPTIMQAAKTYFYYVALSLPFLGIYSGGAALFRAIGNSKVSMQISMVSNAINVAGNAILIYGFRFGVAGAAFATFFSRMVSAVLIVILIVKSKELTLNKSWRFDFYIMRKVLYIGVPNGVENSIFQVGKIIITSLLTSFGTVAITANAVTNSIGSFQQIPNTAIGIAMITVIGQAIGAEDVEQAKFYLKKLMKQSYFYMIVLGIILIVVARPVTELYHLSKETTDLTVWLLIYNSICSMIALPPAFTLPNALRAAGDVKFTMVVSVVCMWTCRIILAYILAATLQLGIMGIWIAMTIDWVVRGGIFTNRVRTGKWLMYKDRIIQEKYVKNEG